MFTSGLTVSKQKQQFTVQQGPMYMKLKVRK